MNDKHLKVITSVILILLVCNTWQLHSVRQQLREISNTSNHTNSQLFARISDLQYDVDNQYHRINALLNQQASLFSKTSVDMKLLDGHLAVTMQATPKELQNKETMFARIVIGNKVYEQATDQSGRATLLLEPADLPSTIQPSFVIQSPSGVRQEVLAEESVIDYISAPIESSWHEDFNGSDTILDLYLYDFPNQPFTADQIEDVKCIVVGKNFDRNEPAPDIKATPTVDPMQQTIPQGDTVAVVKQSDSTANTVHYQADFSNYQKQQDGIQYQVYVVLTTTDGFTFATLQNPVADFSFEKGGASAGCGSERLIPVRQ